MAPHECIGEQIPGVINDGGLGGHGAQALPDGVVVVGLDGVLKPSRERKRLAHHVDQEDFLLPKPFQGAGLAGAGAAID